MRFLSLMMAFALVATGVFAQGAVRKAKKAEPILDPQMGAVGARFPSVSPDGSKVAFTLWGDIWVMPTDGGRAERITLNKNYDTRPMITPSGTHIVFISDRKGSYDLFVVPIDGGIPRRLTYHQAYDVPTGFTKDGNSVLFFSSRTAGWNRAGSTEMWKVALAGGTPVRLTKTGGREGVTPDDGNTIYYVDGPTDTKVQEYVGTANDEIYFQKGDEPAQHVLEFEGNTREPRISADGKQLYFTREINGSFELFRADTETWETEQLTNLGEDGMSGTSFTEGNKTVVFNWKWYLWSLDLTSEGAKPKLLKINIREDYQEPRKIERKFTRGVDRAHLSKSGKSIVLELGGDIWVLPANGGTARAITNDKFQNHNPRVSPDGRTISFYSNRNGNDDLWLIDTNGGNLRQFTTDPANDFFQNWSPDGQSIVFCSERSGNRDIWIKGMDGSAARRLTNHPTSDDDPCFSPDGRLIAFDSGRGGNADIYVMNVDGSGQRRVYGTPAIEEVPAFSPDGRFLVFDRITRGASFIRQEVVVTDIAGSGEVLLGEGKYAQYTADGKEILYINGNGELVYARAPIGINSGRKIPFVAVRVVSEKEEMLKAFDEAHSAFKQRFYDPNFHGKDWEALGKKYRALVAACGCREEFLRYLNQMVGEVSASHTGASGQTQRSKPFNTGLLGMTMTPVVHKGGMLKLQVSGVEHGGPADKAWIRDGDYIFRINGRAMSIMQNAYALLEGTAGKPIGLVVADNAGGVNARQVTVVPESFGQRRQRLYRDYLRKCTMTSARRSRGQVAYLHIAAMNQQSLALFQNQLASPQVQRAKALIIDVRDNGGGNIHQQLIDILSRRSYAQIRLRDGRKIGQPTVAWDRPFAVLINERSYSDAEVFPHAIKTLGMGTIVGVQTPGAVIGTQNITLSDGTSWRLPMSGFFNIDGTNQEHNGCVPDVPVQITPADRLAGKDPQLETAVDLLLKQIREGGKPSVKPGPVEKPAKEGEFSILPSNGYALPTEDVWLPDLTIG